MRKKGKIYWKDLSKRDMKHLAEYGVRTKTNFTREVLVAREDDKNMFFNHFTTCPRCTAIAQELGL